MVAGLVTVFLCVKPATTLPSGFRNEVVTNVSAPTALAFMPDGDILVTSKTGQLHVFDQNGKALSSPALDIGSKVCAGDTERGLLGVAVDPQFGVADHNYVYLYYTYKRHGVCPVRAPGDPKNPVNRVSRLEMSGDTVNPDTEKVLIDNIPSPNGNHNAGDLKFGKDGYLYISVGDGGCDYAQPPKCGSRNDASRDRHVLLGKVLRITPNGDIPPDNPYTNPDNSARCNLTGRTEAGKNCQETFARGLRNPFRMAFDPDSATTNFRINDVGQNAREEIDRGLKGADYAWNLCEGNRDNPSRPGSVGCTKPPYTPPMHQYNHNTGCRSITGGAFVPDDGSWPDAYDNAYLFADFICDKIFMLRPKSGGGFARTQFAIDPQRAGPVAVTFGPYGATGTALYYTNFANGGKVRRIVATGV